MTPKPRPPRPQVRLCWSPHRAGCSPDNSSTRPCAERPVLVGVRTEASLEKFHSERTVSGRRLLLEITQQSGPRLCGTNLSCACGKGKRQSTVTERHSRAVSSARRVETPAGGPDRGQLHTHTHRDPRGNPEGRRRPRQKGTPSAPCTHRWCLPTRAGGTHTCDTTAALLESKPRRPDPLPRHPGHGIHQLPVEFLLKC